MSSEWKNLPYERISGNFSDFIDFGHQVRVCKKKDHFSILPVIQNIWDLHKFGLQILNSERKNYSMKEFRAIFFNFIDFGHQVRVCKKRSFLNITCNSKIYRTYINLGCRFEFRTQKLPYERILGNFSDFSDFGHQVRVCKKI